MTTELPPEVSDHPLLQESEWLAKRDSGISPLIQSDLSTTEQARQEFLVGAWLLGILGTIHPQMLRIVDMLNGGHLMNAVIMPRRSAKTTTLFCILLGRCYLRPAHMAGFTLLTTQKKTSERYRLDIYGPIARRWPEDDTRPVKLIRSNGSERVEFSNGSNLAVLSPDGDAVRSGAYDTLLLDEAGESTPERWEDIIGAVIPAFDTRPEGQLILAGTAGDYRDGSDFWGTITDERAGRVAYMLPDDTDPDELERWEPDEDHPRARARALTEAMHPGIGTLTSLDRIQNSYERLGVKRYTREYFNLFGAEGSNTALINAPIWQASAVPLPEAGMEVPDLFALSFYVHPDGLWASVGAAWRGADERIHVGLLWHQSGTKGFAKQLLLLARKHKRPVIYDSQSNAAAVELAILASARPAPQLQGLVTNDVSRGVVHFLKTLNEDGIRHYDQQELNQATEIAVKRGWGTAGKFAFGRPPKDPDRDITGLEAVSMAAYALDGQREMSSDVQIDWFG